MNHQLEAVEVVSWNPRSAPNASYTDVLTILNNCPEHDQGVLFAYLSDIQPDPHYGIQVVYDGQEGTKAAYIAALVACGTKNKREDVGTAGHKIVHNEVKDIANPEGTIEQPVGDYTLVGYCSSDGLRAFSLDPPRGKPFQFALVLFSKADKDEGLQIHKLEYVDAHRVEDAVKCMQRLRKLSKSIHTVCTEKRSHSIDLEHEGKSPNSTKKAKTLQAVPSDESLPG